MIRLIAIARNAFIEAIRQPIYGVLLLVTFAILVLDLPLADWTMGRGLAEYRQTDQQFMINLGLSTLLVSGLFISAFSASGVISREIEDKTILTVLSKPVARPIVVLGKFLGVAAVLIIAYYLCSLVFLMTVRHRVMPTAADPFDWPVIILGGSAFVISILLALFCNYFFNWHFVPSAVGFLVVMLSLAMGAITFIGKDWKAVPPGYDVLPKPRQGIARVEIKRGYSIDDFLRKASEKGFSAGQIDRERNTLTVHFSEDIKPSRAVEMLKEFDAVKTASTIEKTPPAITGQLLISIALQLLAVMIFVSVAVAASTRLGQVMTLLVCVGFFFIGSTSHYLFGRFAQSSFPARVAYLLWSNLTFFYTMDALMAGKVIGMDYVALAGLYAFCHIVAILAIGMVLFHRRELAAEPGIVSVSAPPLISLLAWSGRAAALAAGIIALSIIGKAEAMTTKNLVYAAVLLAAAVGGWLGSGWFGAGAKWMYVTVAICAVGLLVVNLVIVIIHITQEVPMTALIATVACAIVLIILSMPRTRHYFGFLHARS